MADSHKVLNYRIILNNYLGLFSHLFCVFVLEYAFDPGNVFLVLSAVGIVIRHDLGCKVGLARAHSEVVESAL